MLVLTRKKNETVVIPELGITVMIVEVRGDKVKLGFEAPKEIGILRDELVRKGQLKERSDDGSATGGAEAGLTGDARPAD